MNEAFQKSIHLHHAMIKQQTNSRAGSICSLTKKGHYIFNARFQNHVHKEWDQELTDQATKWSNFVLFAYRIESIGLKHSQTSHHLHLLCESIRFDMCVTTLFDEELLTPWHPIISEAELDLNIRLDTDKGNQLLDQYQSVFDDVGVRMIEYLDTLPTYRLQRLFV